MPRPSWALIVTASPHGETTGDSGLILPRGPRAEVWIGRLVPSVQGAMTRARTVPAVGFQVVSEADSLARKRRTAVQPCALSWDILTSRAFIASRCGQRRSAPLR